jgi:hypothetical protein
LRQGTTSVVRKTIKNVRALAIDRIINLDSQAMAKAVNLFALERHD